MNLNYTRIILAHEENFEMIKNISRLKFDPITAPLN